MLMKKTIVFLCLVLIKNLLPAQSDSSKILSLDEFYEIISTYHPMAKQAALLVEKGKKQLRSSRGEFDPKVYSTLSEKDFKDKNYYNIQETGVKIPTWYGITLKTAYERNTGIFLNPENNVPGEGLGVFGAEITLGKGLFIDERRANLRKAQIYRESSLMERELLLNNLYFEATVSYWDWVVSYRNLQTYNEAISFSQLRFEGIKNSFLGGDLPAIDTLEAFIQLQDVQLSYITAQSDFINSLNKLSVFLWDENESPIILDQQIVPPTDFENLKPEEFNLISNNLDSYIENHPKVKILDYKRSSLVIDKRLKAEKLKPSVDLNYNFITTDYNTKFTTNDFKWGFKFGIPLFLREGRGALAVAKIKIQDNEYSRLFFTTDIKNKVTAQLNQIENLINQFEQYSELIKGYSRLLSTEEVKFQIGESSMFKVNARQLKLLNTQVKANKQLGKLYQSRGKLYKEMGILHLNP